MTAATLTQPRAQSRVTAVVAASIGNALEWFDFAVYGFFALTISKLFFPAEDEALSLLLTFGTFGVTFVMRPLGRNRARRLRGPSWPQGDADPRRSG